MLAVIGDLEAGEASLAQAVDQGGQGPVPLAADAHQAPIAEKLGPASHGAVAALGFGEAEAQTFAEALADRLEVGGSHVIAAYEDPLAYIHKEGQLPIDVDPIDNKLEDPEERERLRRVFSRGRSLSDI